MKGAPILPTLDLWALGHSGADIAAKLGFPNRKHVERIIGQARDIGDPRAVFHVAGERILGKAIPPKDRYLRFRQETYAGFQLVERIVRPLCLRGHARTPDNLDAASRCRICELARQVRRPARKR